MKKKGFTLVELVTAIAILGLLSAISVFSYNGIMKMLDKKYYATLENNLILSGSEYFSNNRGERPIDAYSVADMNTLINNKYIDQLQKRTGGNCESGNVYIIKNNNGNYDYEACIICGTYQSTGKYCSGNIPGIITVKATSGGKSYNPLLSYEKIEWSKSDVNVTFSMTDNVDTYKITNVNNNNITTCLASSNTCTKIINESGTYKVGGYLNNVLVGEEKVFSIKEDKIAPVFTINETTDFTIPNGSSLYNYTNEITNLVEANLESIKYSLAITGEADNYKTMVSTLYISESIGSGPYTLKVKVTDLAGNETIKTVNLNIISSTPIILTCAISMTEGTLTGTLTNEGTGGYTYTWKNANGDIISTAETASSIEEAYTFTLTVKDRSNNTGSCSFSCGEFVRSYKKRATQISCQPVGDATWAHYEDCVENRWYAGARWVGTCNDGTIKSIDTTTKCYYNSQSSALSNVPIPSPSLFGCGSSGLKSKRKDITNAVSCTAVYQNTRTCG